MEKAGIQDEINVALDANSRTKSRIVQSPERLKRIIATMGDNAVEERRNIAANEAKARALKLKLDTLVTYEQVILLFQFTTRQNDLCPRISNPISDT